MTESKTRLHRTHQVCCPWSPSCLLSCLRHLFPLLNSLRLFLHFLVADRWYRDGHCARLLRLPDIPSRHIVVFNCVCSRRLAIDLRDHFHGSSETIRVSSIIGGGACVTESMSVLMDPATYGILNSELTNCSRTAALLGKLAIQWRQIMGFLQRVEQETVASQNLFNTIENMNKTRIDATGNRLRLKDGERLHPKSWSGSMPPGGFEREVAAWLGYVDPKHEAGKVNSPDHEGDAQSDRGMDSRLAVAPANATEGAARSTVLKVTQMEPSHGSVA